MNYDSKAWNKSNVFFIGWNRELDKNIQSIANSTISARYGVQPSEPVYLVNGAFNCCYKVRVKDFDVLFRFPILGKSAFRYEKTNDEAAIMAYISQHTTIPTPKVIRVTASAMGPYIVMEFVEGTLLLTHLEAPSLDRTAPPVLNPNISIPVITKSYRHMAHILIELSKCRFTQIGGVIRDESKHWRVGKRPMTINMNHLVSFANFPPTALPEQSFTTANEYFSALAEIHMTHLRTQRNDAAEDDKDYQKKYIARCLFRRIARSFSTTYNHGPFPLYCDDLGPGNLIVDDDLDVKSTIDWEYCYAAPAELTYCSPWWLLLSRPTIWEEELSSFLEQYIPRHQLFLGVLREYEDERIADGLLSECQRLSDSMAQSLSNGNFWFCIAVTSSFIFDDVYWQFIDPIYYGKFTSIEDRIALLSSDEQKDLEPFVRLKAEQAREGRLDDHRTLDELLTA
ncbi:putative phosphotransferase enzyme family protein [Phaeomoniella chlamydospora]|uniref:Putative phosphotransferase enzyme family protein n=1 Tax=Phaeomoniella chlamydospora TaxID=158046 RepID=A0A0G2EPU5_PHACM|nr:putative phosphotransferase enzyme family protein [Phaeomoniella chlamydospora]